MTEKAARWIVGLVIALSCGLGVDNAFEWPFNTQLCQSIRALYLAPAVLKSTVDGSEVDVPDDPEFRGLLTQSFETLGFRVVESVEEADGVVQVGFGTTMTISQWEKFVASMEHRWPRAKTVATYMDVTIRDRKNTRSFPDGELMWSYHKSLRKMKPEAFVKAATQRLRKDIRDKCDR